VGRRTWDKVVRLVRFECRVDADAGYALLHEFPQSAVWAAGAQQFVVLVCRGVRADVLCGCGACGVATTIFEN
jgi:hypothetical protein